MIASERVPAGTSDQRSGGELFSPSHVYSIGMSPPSSKATEEISISEISELSGSNSGFESLSPQPAVANTKPIAIKVINDRCQRV